LSKEIEVALNNGYKIRLCAETPAYADHLAERLGIPVSVVPYPVHAELVQVNAYPSADETAETKKADNERFFNIACPGSARFDKGYLNLLEIFSSVRRRDPKQTIKFVTQTLPVSEALSYANYTNQLYATPGVKLLPSSVSEDQMNSLYKQSDLVILPYDPITYEYRGSAVFMECISRGIPVIALAGSAFCKQIDYYGAGTVVSNVGEFVEQIFHYRDMPKKSMSTKMLQARHRYSVDSDSAIANWIGQ
jgi:glycosyltransferase involved in cell wall biosynthesis